jgi:hypothetical protein
VPKTARLCVTCRSLSAVIVTPTIEEMTVLALVGVSLLALGSRVFEPRIFEFRPFVAGFSAPRLFLGYLALLVVDRISGPFVGGGLAQPLIALGNCKFVFVVLLVFLWVTTGQGLISLLGVVIIETTLGLTGFFGGFKTIFLIVGIASLIVMNLYWQRVRSILLITVPILLLLGAIWTAVKPTYRAFLNQGKRNQEVVTTLGQNLGKLEQMSSALDAGNIFDGLVGSALRLSYIEIPSYVLERVPDVIPYQYGALWGDAIYQVITPRFLFPDKRMLPSDSVRTNHYTGYSFDARFTSVSMGYIIESYIDFGIPGAVLIPFILGTLYLLIGRHILYLGSRHDETFCIAILLVAFLLVQEFEISNVKLIPGFLWSWIVCGLLVWLVWPRVRPLFWLPCSNEEL